MTTLEAAATPRGERRARAAADQEREAIDLVVFRVLPLVEAALNRVAEEFTGRVVAASEPIDDADVSAIQQLWAAQIPELATAMAQVYVGASNATLRSLATSATTTSALRSSYIASASNRLGDVGTDLWREASQTLAAGNLAGEGYDQLRRRLQDTFREGGAELGESRAMRIARTEVQSAVNRGTLDAMRATPSRPRYKTWLAAMGPRTREEHAEADGQTVQMDASFEVGGELLEYPGDPNGSPDNIINCRCTVVYGDDPDGFSGDADREMKGVDYCGKSDDDLSEIAAATDDDEYCAMLDDPALQTTDGALSFADDREGSQAWAADHYTQWNDGLAPGEVRAIRQYTGEDYTDINRGLRRGADVDPDWTWNSQVAQIDGALGRSIVPEDITVYRQVADYSNTGMWSQLKVGDEFIDNGFVSTSLSNLDPVKLRSTPTAVDMRITVRAGSNGAPIARVMNDAVARREDEFLLPRGSRFRVRSVGSDGSLDLEVV